MINRRKLLAISGAGIVAVAAGSRAGVAQDADGELQFENASFIRDLSDVKAATPTALPDATPNVQLELDNLRGYLLGDPEAPNTLKVFADYRCPHCRMFHTDIEPGLIADFVESGRMNIELLDFPVVGVESFDRLDDDSIETVQACEAAACAAEQGEYLAYRDWLYEGELVTSVGDFSDDNLIAAAGELGLDVDQFSAAFLDGVYEPAIIAMTFHGVDLGVRGTPTLILNDGEPFFVPEEGYEPLKEQIEAELQE